MPALTHHGPGGRTWGEVPFPALRDPEDAIVRVDAVTICGTDLHILKGGVPEVAEGRVPGHDTDGAVRVPGPDGLGADVAIEAVGVPGAFELCTRVVRPGGRAADVGVHGRPAVLHLEDLWAPGRPVGRGRHHHGPGRDQQHPAAARPAHRGAARRGRTGHPPVRPR